MIKKKNEFVVITGGYGTTCGVDIDYDNPDMEKIKDMVLKDFSRKLLSIYNDCMYMMPRGLFMYGIFERRYYDEVTMSITQEYKEDVTKFTDTEEVAKFVYDYFNKSYVGPNDMKVKSPDVIRKWFGAGEFPFIYVNLFRDMDGYVSVNYTISR